MTRWHTFLKNTDFRARFRLLVLIAFPLWVCSLPLFHFAILPWVAGFLMPYTLIGVFQRNPWVQFYVIVGMMLSCVLVFQMKALLVHVTLICCWVWFCLAFAAGTQWWLDSSAPKN